MVLARRDAGTPDGHRPPSVLRPLLRFHGRLPPRALATVRRVLDDDDGFRRRVAAEVDEVSAQRATWLYLRRPDGWREEFAVLVDAATEAGAREQEQRSEQAAARRVEHLGAALARQRDELERAVRVAERSRTDLEAERSRRLTAESELAAVTARLAQLEAGRQVAVVQLAEARELAEARLARVRELEQDPGQTSAGQPHGADLVAVADAVRRANQAATMLGASLDEAVRALSPGFDEPAADRPARRWAPAAGDDPEAGQGERVRLRRVPHRLARGAVEGSFEGTDQVLRVPGAIVVVDGYNVSMQGWPTVGKAAQRERLVALMAGVVNRTGADLHVVFDGDDDGRRPAVSVPLPVRVHFTAAGVEADDVVLEMVERWPVDRTVVVVTSDRRVQTGARERGANVVPSEAILDWARR